MEARYLEGAIAAYAFKRRKMAFVSGPRQAGKTTLEKRLSRDADQFFYGNWDASEIRKIFAKDPALLLTHFNLEKSKDRKLLALDEIHKAPLWKQKIKGLFDVHRDEIDIIVTGGARLDVYRKGGDSLLGRYIHFRMHPFSLGEALHSKVARPQDFRKSPKEHPKAQGILKRLLERSGFPEPYLKLSKKEHRIWQMNRRDRIIREDLRDLSRLPELSQIEALASLLPERIGSPLSVKSLREDLETSFDSVKRWLRYMEDLYYFFTIRPWTPGIKRSLKREPKIYLYDWTEVESAGARFENLVACHLQKACHFWTDTGEGKFELFYLRNKEKDEVDFLITHNRKPWLGVEAKLKPEGSSALRKFQSQLGIEIWEVCLEEGVFRKNSKAGIYQMSASQFLGGI